MRGPPLLSALAAALVLLTLAMAGLASAKVVHNNEDQLPPGCDELADERSITVRGGRNHTEGFPGTVYAFDEREWQVEPCTRITIRFINEDLIRHQFMVHGTFPEGFLLIEVDGPGEDTGTFIAGARTSTLLVHCGVNQHQQKGMKAQILVGGGIGDLPNIPGISGVPQGEAGHTPGAGQGTSEEIHVGWTPALVAFGVAAVTLARRARRGA